MRIVTFRSIPYLCKGNPIKVIRVSTNPPGTNKKLAFKLTVSTFLAPAKLLVSVNTLEVNSGDDGNVNPLTFPDACASKRSDLAELTRTQKARGLYSRTHLCGPVRFTRFSFVFGSEGSNGPVHCKCLVQSAFSFGAVQTLRPLQVAPSPTQSWPFKTTDLPNRTILTF